MTGWLLIFYLAGYNAGGPGVATFTSKEACEKAATAIKENGKLGPRFEGYVCVPQSG